MQYSLMKLTELWKKCGEVYVTKEVFNACIATIGKWISISELTDLMMRHRLVTSPAQVEEFTKTTLSQPERILNLLSHVNKNGGKHGYFLLYVCLYESQERVPLGHKDAVDELQREGKF